MPKSNSTKGLQLVRWVFLGRAKIVTNFQVFFSTGDFFSFSSGVSNFQGGVFGKGIFYRTVGGWFVRSRFSNFFREEVFLQFLLGGSTFRGGNFGREIFLSNCRGAFCAMEIFEIFF